MLSFETNGDLEMGKGIDGTRTALDLKSGEAFELEFDDGELLSVRSSEDKDVYFYDETRMLVGQKLGPNKNLQIYEVHFDGDGDFVGDVGRVRNLNFREAKILKTRQDCAPEVISLIEKLFPAAAGWVKTSDHEIAYIEEKPAINKRMTDIFNFKAREHQRIVDDLSSGAQSATPLRGFDQVEVKEILLEAIHELNKQGGNVDERSITIPGFVARDKKTFPDTSL